MKASVEKYITGVVLLLAIGLFDGVRSAGAQVFGERERASLSYGIEPLSDFKGDVAGEVEIQRTGVSASYPLIRKSPQMFFVGARLDYTHFNFKGAALHDYEVYSIRVPFRYVYQGTTNWSVSVMVAPGVGTDFKRVNSDDFLWFSMVLATWKAGPEWTWVGGLVYGQSFGESRFFPALGATWRMSDQWQMSLVLPRPGVTYSPSKKRSLSLYVEPAGDSWNVQGDNRESQDLVLEGWRAGFGIRQSVAPHWILTADAGYVFGRSLQIEEGDRTIFDEDLAEAPSLRVGIAYR